MTSLLAIASTTMPRSELGAHRSRASFVRQYYLLLAFNNGNNSRERFVTPVTARVFRSFLAPRDGEMLLYTIWVLGVGCILNSAVLPWKSETGTGVLQDVVTCRGFVVIVLFVGYFPPQMHRQLLTTGMSRLRRCYFFSLEGEYVVRYFPLLDGVCLPCFG